MKKYIFGIAAIIYSTGVFAQKLNPDSVPTNLTSSFKARFANIKTVEWIKVDSVYKAEFLLDDYKTVARFTNKAIWLNTIWEIPLEYIPSKIKSYADSAFAKSKINKFQVVEFPVEGKIYQIEISGKKKCHELQFTLKSEFKRTNEIACPKKK